MSEQHENTAARSHPGGPDSNTAGATAAGTPAGSRRYKSLAEELHRIRAEAQRESSPVAAPPQTPPGPRQWPWIKRAANQETDTSSGAAGILTPWAKKFASVPASPPKPLGVRDAMSIGLFEMMSNAHRIRNLRAALGWTQRMIAERLGISTRTVIRYEKGQRKAQWIQLPVLRRLRHLESEHAEELLAYLNRSLHA